MMACNNPEVPCALVISNNFLFLIRDDWWDMSFVNAVGETGSAEDDERTWEFVGRIRRIWEPFRIHSWHTAPKTEILGHKDVVHCWLIEGYKTPTTQTHGPQSRLSRNTQQTSAAKYLLHRAFPIPMGSSEPEAALPALPEKHAQLGTLSDESWGRSTMTRCVTVLAYIPHLFPRYAQGLTIDTSTRCSVCCH